MSLPFCLLRVRASPGNTNSELCVAMSSRHAVRLSALVTTIILLQFTGFTSMEHLVPSDEPAVRPDVPAFPSFAIESPRRDLPVSSPVSDLLRRQSRSPDYVKQPALPKPVKRYMHVFTTSGRIDFRSGLELANEYSSTFGPVLNEYGLPTELIFLAYVESNFDHDARSYANAVGPWQFTAATARRYGLQVDETVDERKDFLKSTHAAGRYLRDLYLEFGSLELTLAAYNTGENRVRSAILRGGTADFWTLASRGYFPRQTVNHVAKFSAALLLARDMGPIPVNRSI